MKKDDLVFITEENQEQMKNLIISQIQEAPEK